MEALLRQQCPRGVATYPVPVKATSPPAVEQPTTAVLPMVPSQLGAKTFLLRAELMSPLALAMVPSQLGAKTFLLRPGQMSPLALRLRRQARPKLRCKRCLQPLFQSKNQSKYQSKN